MGLIVVLALFLLAYGAVAIFAWRRPFLRKLAVREATRRRGHSALVISGLMVGTATITAALVGADSVSDSAVDAFAYRNWGHIDLTVSSQNRFFPSSVAARLIGDPEVRAVTDGVQAGIELVGSVSDLDARQGSSRVRIVGLDPATQAPFGTFETLDGRTTLAGDIGGVLVSRVLAEKLDVESGHRLRISVDAGGHREIEALVSGIVRAEGPGAYTLGATVFAPLGIMRPLAGQDGINVVRISARGGIKDTAETAAAALPVVRRALAKFESSVPLEVRNAKAAEVESAKDFTSFIRAMLIGMSALVVAAGAALILNLIGMLAEERRSRLGVLRALGLKRRRLIGLSVIEGAIYSVIAGAVGALVGILVGRVVAERFASAFAEFAGEDFDFTFGFVLKPATLLAGFAVGSFLTLGIVYLASRRTARMTITAAIRNLPEPPAGKEKKRWSVRVRRILVVLAGAALIATNQAPGRMAGGLIILMFIGARLKSRLSPKMHATLLGLALAGWAFGNIWTQSPDADPGTFFLTFVMAMLSAVFGLTTLTAAQLPIVERLVGALGSARSRAVLRPPLAFLARRPTRTGLTTGVFAVIISMLTLFAVFFVIFRPDYVAYGNGYDVRVISTGSADVATPASLAGQIEREVKIPTRGYVGPTKSDDAFSTSERMFVPLYEVARGFATSPPVKLEQRSELYATDRDAWNAVINDPTKVITNFSVVDRTFTLEGRKGPVTFTVVGLQPFGMMDGLFGSPRALEPFHDAPLGAVVLLDIKDQARADEVAKVIEADLFEVGVDADSVQGLLDTADRANKAFFSTIDILMRMGLVVGILALGIVALRVVVERRHIIGVLRAIGYKRRSVMAGLMAEAAITVAVGAFVGISVGVTMGWIFYNQGEAQSGFGIDVASIGGVLGLVFVAVILVTIGPAWRASRLPPAEAVRYTE